MVVCSVGILALVIVILVAFLYRKGVLFKRHPEGMMLAPTTETFPPHHHHQPQLWHIHHAHSPVNIIYEMVSF